MTPQFIEKIFYNIVCHFYADGSLFLPDSQTLILSDLHLGKGAASHSRTPLPGYDTDDTLKRMKLAIERSTPKQTLLLGDSFHTVKGADELPEHHLDTLFHLARQTEFLWIEGNHDPMLPSHLPGQTAHVMSMNNLLFSHQPQFSSEIPDQLLAGQIIGHYHPKSRLRLKARTYSAKCFFYDDRLMILPAFGSFTGGLNILHPEIQLLASTNQQIILLKPPALYHYPVDRRVFVSSP